MTNLERHEIFEIEVLEKLKKSGLLEPLVFGGGTMLRLCHELPRYSVDLDFWFIKTVEEDAHFSRLCQAPAEHYEITDAATKYHTQLCEIRSPHYPRRLKIEIRRELEQETRDYYNRNRFTFLMDKIRFIDYAG